MRKLLFGAIAAFALWGCKEDSPSEILETGTKPSPHYITEYLVASKIDVEVNKDSGKLCLKVSGDEYTTWHKNNISEEALYFIELYNDKSYHGSVHPGMTPALAYPLDKITIYCDKDFDAEHPAGEPLDKIALLYFSSYYPFIEGGYKGIHPFNYDRISYIMHFDDVNADRTKLMCAHFLTSKISPSYVAEIEFLSQPAELGEYTFTLEMTTNGETLKTEFTHTFE